MSMSNKKAELQTHLAIERAKTAAILDDARRRQLSPLETAKEMFKGVDMFDLARVIKVVNIMMTFLRQFHDNDDDIVHSNSFQGYRLQITGQLYDSPEHEALAAEWQAAFDKFETLEDVLTWVLQKEGCDLDSFLSKIKEPMDKTWYLGYLHDTPVRKYLVMAYTQEAFAIKETEAMAQIKKSCADVEEKEKIHATLMSDPGQ